MSTPPTALPHALALLVMALGAAVIAYVVARRPREPSSWALACAAAGVFGIYLSEFFLYRAGLSVAEGFFWQKAMSVGAGIASIGAVALAFTLRETPVPRWEQAIAGALVLRAILDIIVIVTLVPHPQPGCLGPWGSPLLHCGSAHRLDAGSALLSIPLALGLFYRTFRLASRPRQRIFIAYLLPAFVLICLGSTISILWGLRGKGTLFPTGVIVAPAAVFAGAGLLHLETRGLSRFRPPSAIALLFGWAGLMAIAFIIDVRWLKGQTPLASLLTLIGGLAAALAYTVLRAGLAPAASQRIVHAAAQQTPITPSNISEEWDNPAASVASDDMTPSDNGGAQPPRLRIQLFGPFRVEREGKPLSGDARLWRSDKGKSLLAYLALAGQYGLTRSQIIDALWPLNDELDGDAERRALNTARSYISTLRRILGDNEAGGNTRTCIVHEGDRYRLDGQDHVWVDVWEFERLVRRAEQLAQAGRLEQAAGLWAQAVALHGELALLPDEAYLPSEVVEPEREQLRQRWLMGLRWLGRYHAEHGPIERAVVAWETVWRAAPLDEEAYGWLAGYYRRTGQAVQLAALQEARCRAERELGEEAVT